MRVVVRPRVLQPPRESLTASLVTVNIMSSVTDITDDAAFSALMSSLPPTTVAAISFHTPWAAPCKQMRLILETLAASYPSQTPEVVSFLSVDAEELPDISETYDVTAVPLLVLQRDGKILESVSGSDASNVRHAIERHAGKSGNNGKLGLPPALAATSRHNAEAAAAQPSADHRDYALGAANGAATPELVSTQGSKEELDKRLAELVKAAPVMLFMKGTPSSPQCGFSRQLVGLLRDNGVRYGFFNILADDDVRQGLKVWSDWPTFPQLYLHGELVGGLDIVKEEIDNNPDYFAEFQVPTKGRGGMVAPEGHKEPLST